MNNSICLDFVKSWCQQEGIVPTKDVLAWIKEKNTNLSVSIKQINFSDCINWFYDNSTGSIKNASGAFFSIVGTRSTDINGISNDQPMIVQDEIGYLGILCKRINGCIHLLMQAKIEPGNINKIQISPTIQATKSNFTQKHGGKKPPYLDYFLNSAQYTIIVDQIQSEQSSRFLGKRNRNIILLLDDDEDIDVLPSHKWMTLGQIKKLMRINNLVNMDTRTVLSCIPFSLCCLDSHEVENYFTDKALCKSIFNNDDIDFSQNLFRSLNDIKMFNADALQRISLEKMTGWRFGKKEIISDFKQSFKVIFCDIAIEGREVRRWTQPLFAATGIATFGLMSRIINGKREFLIKLKKEIGCFDVVEFGPSIQIEPNFDKQFDSVERLFFEKCKKQENIILDVLLSEEGGRFYQEQNRNVLMHIRKDELDELPSGYFWVDFKTINYLCQFNNILNIQLRNLLSLWEV